MRPLLLKGSRSFEEPAANADHAVDDFIDTGIHGPLGGWTKFALIVMLYIEETSKGVFSSGCRNGAFVLHDLKPINLWIC